MLSLFDSPKAKRQVLPPNIRRAIIDLKCEHPPLNFEEIANICGKIFRAQARRPYRKSRPGRKPHSHETREALRALP